MDELLIFLGVFAIICLVFAFVGFIAEVMEKRK